MIDAFSLLLALAGVGVVVCLMWRRRVRRRRVARVATLVARAAARRAETETLPAVPAQPTGARPKPRPAIPGATLVDGDATQALPVQAATAPSGADTTQQLPVLTAETAGTEPSDEDWAWWQRIPAPDDAPTPLAPDHWRHMSADPGEATPALPGEVPAAPTDADLTFTQITERAEWLRQLKLAELAALRADRSSPNGALR